MKQATQIAQQQPRSGENVPLPIQMNPAYATPVYGTATPSGGIPQRIRELAYRFPDWDAQRWLLLLMADRVAEEGEIAKEAITPGQQYLVIRHFSRLARAHPFGFAVAVGMLGFALFAFLTRGGRGRRK